RTATHALAKELGVRGLMNIQFAVKRVDGERLAATDRERDEQRSEDRGQRSEISEHSSTLGSRPSTLDPRLSTHIVYILEVNPRASRTSPFVSKATGRSLAKIAAKVMAGVSLVEQGVTEEI